MHAVDLGNRMANNKSQGQNVKTTKTFNEILRTVLNNQQ